MRQVVIELQGEFRRPCVGYHSIQIGPHCPGSPAPTSIQVGSPDAHESVSIFWIGELRVPLSDVPEMAQIAFKRDAHKVVPIPPFSKGFFL